ncbi:hypothetical protein [Arthrobacter sp. N1]|uniref:hypothetical protein n=1 Tax=Arthrobacter sp. N1 TaxID=619291 RepID=UPI003BB05583
MSTDTLADIHMNRQTDAISAAIEQVGILVSALEHWQDVYRASLKTAGQPGGYEQFRAVSAIRAAVERAAGRAMDAAYMPHEAFDIQPSESMTVHHPVLKDALALVSGDYQAALPEVKNGGLFQAMGLDATRTALQYEIREAGL